MHLPPSIRRLLLGAALTLTGCLHVEQHLTLDANGSGRLETQYAISEEQLAMIRQTAARCGNQEGVPPVADPAALLGFTEQQVHDSFKAYESGGLRLNGCSVTTSNGWRTVSLDVHFRNLAALAHSEFLGLTSLRLTRTPAGTWVLEHDPVLHHELAGDLASDRGAIDAAMEKLLKGFRARVQLTAPGDLLATTADRQEGRTAIWVIDPGTDARAWRRARTESMRAEFSGAGLSLEELPSPAAGGTPRGGT